MSTFLPFLITGVVSGSLLGLAASGLVLSFKTSGLFNFAHGAVAAAGAYVFYELSVRQGLPWGLAAAIVVLGFAPLMGLLLERLAAGLQDVRPVFKIVATVGLLLLIQGIATARYGVGTIPLEPFLPQETFTLGGTVVSYEQLIDVIVALLAVGGLLLLFRSTTVGLQMRGVVDNPGLLSFQGDNPTAVRRIAWVISSGFACATGILLAPSLGLDTFVLALLVVQAFGAAAIGGFSSIGRTYAGGVAIGVASSIGSKVIGDHVSGSAFLSSIPSSLPFIVLFVLLVAIPARRFFDVPAGTRTLTGGTSVPRVSRFGVLALGAGALAVPVFVSSDLPVWTTGMSLVVVFLGLGLMVWTSGQVSLAHASFAAIGASAMSKLLDAHVPWGLALLLAGLVAMPVALAVALPTIRLSGLYLALATFGFAVLLQTLVYSTKLMFGGGLTPVARPDGLSGDRAYYYVCAAVAGLAALLTFGVQRSRLGRLLRAFADSPTAVSSNGGDTTVIRTAVFCIAGFLAAIGGALASGVTLQASSQGYGYTVSLTWVAVLALFGSRATVVRATLAALALSVAPIVLTMDPAYYTTLFGGSALAAALVSDRGPLRRAQGSRVEDRLAARGRTKRLPAKVKAA